MRNETHLVDLQTFALVGQHGSFTAAAHELQVPTSTVSRRVTRLEAELGVALVHRSARSVALSEAGEQLAMRTAGALRELADAEQAALEHRAGPRGLLRLTAPADLGTSPPVIDLLVAYRRRWPEVRLEVDLSHRVVDLLAEGVDVALRPMGPRATWSAEGLQARVLARLEAGMYAAPAYLAARGTPEEPADLAHHDWIAHVGWTRGAALTLTHRETGATAELPRQAALGTNHLDQVMGILLRGGGVGAVPAFLAREAVHRGELVQVLPCWALPGGRFAAVWPSTRHPSARLRAFLDLAAERFRPEEDVG